MQYTYVATYLSDLPMEMFVPLLYCSMAYFMFGLRQTVGCFFFTVLVCLLASQVGGGYGVMLGALTTDLQMAQTLASVLVVPLIIFGGFMLKADTVPVYFQWIQYLSW